VALCIDAQLIVSIRQKAGLAPEGLCPSCTFGGKQAQTATLIKTERRCIGSLSVYEGRKRVLLIAASILAARKLAQYDSGARVPATVSAVADSIRWAERIMEEIDRRHPVK
jgi:hypothetical protein